MEEDLVTPVTISDEDDEEWMNLDDHQEDNTVKASTSKAGKSSKSGKPSSSSIPDDDDDEDYLSFMDEDEDSEDLDTVPDIPITGELLDKLRIEASKSFFNEYGLISHQIESYNDFIENGIQRLFDSIGEIEILPGYDPSKNKKAEGDGWRRGRVRFGKVRLEKPMFWVGEKSVGNKDFIKFLPRHARLQKMTYASKIKVELDFKVYTPLHESSDKFKTGTETRVNEKVHSHEKIEILVGSLPVMVKSKLCWMSSERKGECEFDQGGYFLIKGAEKVFIAQERMCLKRLWISDQPNLTIAYRTEIRRQMFKVGVEDVPPELKHLEGTKILTVYFLYCKIPLWVFLFALGMSSDREIIEMIDINSSDTRAVNLLKSSMGYADSQFEGFRRGKSLEEIEKMVSETKFPPKETVSECLEKYLFPSLKSLKQKALFVVYMVKCLLQACTGKRKVENKDDFRNKRLELAGELLERELRNHIKHLEKRMVKSMQRDLYGSRDLHPIDYYLDASIITNGLSRAFSTGGWSHHMIKNERIPGVVANLRRLNPLQMLSDLRKTRQHVNYAGKVGDARFPHPSHWGKLCFLSTSDGENSGLVKNLAVTGLVSTNVIPPSFNKLIECGMEKLRDTLSLSLKDKDKIFLNGEWIGVCGDSGLFVSALRHKRRSKKVSQQVEIKRDEAQGEVRIFSDSGRIMRPLLVVDNLKKIKLCKGDYNINTLINKGIVELVGVEEEEDCLTAWGIKYLLNPEKEYTHCELDPSFLLGLSCGIIPFPNHDHARRALYQSEKHSQQALGYSTTNPNIRVDTLSHQLFYPQRPLFRTMISDCLGKTDYPLGQNVHPKPEIYNGQSAIVAVNVHLGYNQEDSIVMNRASIERGMFRTEHIRCYKAEVENKELLESRRLRTKDKIAFGKIPSKFGHVDSLDDDGFPYVGANLQSGDIVIGRCAESGADHSVKLKHTERGIVQKVILSANDEGTNFGVVSLRQVRSPGVGDKFSSMHGQKGVVGHLEFQENLPFTRQGIVPDLIINPHAFPTRQTPGQLLEAALGKGIAAGGALARYATPFMTPTVEDIMEQLHRAGFMRGGQERCFQGPKGNMMDNMIFIGPTFYQRLNHMAEDKVKFRNTGPVHPLTRQPVQDRKRFGGVKFGEMERDCLLAHGAAANLYERLFTLSDLSQMHVCSKCTNIANVIQRSVAGGGKIRGPYCRTCQSAEAVVKVNVPYGAKLLCQELFSMGISVKFGTESC
ncbi:DNA-directed RNA polymerase [Ranunculus cassubicifolius]